MSVNQQSMWTADESAGPTPLTPAYQRFTTRGLEARERIELWEQHNAQSLVGLTCRSIDGESLDATELNLLLRGMTFARVGATAHVVERTHEHIATTATDGVALYFSLAGEAFFYHRDGVHLQSPGTLLVCDVNQPFVRGFAQGLQEYVLTISRDTFETITDQPMPMRPIVRTFGDGPAGDVHATALARLVHVSLDNPSTDAFDNIETNAVELLHTMFNPDGAGTSAARRRVAVAWITQNLHDPQLSVPRVAEALGLSERSLVRAFSETGVGVARTILDLRLERAHRILSSPASPKVQDVALSCGFVSAAHFSRVFRDQYDQTPAEVRLAAPPA